MEKVGDIEVLFKHGPSSKGNEFYPGFQKESKLLPKDSVHRPGALPLPCDILWERDVELELRDGTTIYTDVYRPPNSVKPVPAIIASGGFGKNGGFNRAVTDKAPWRNGIPQKTVSSLEKFEAPDPAYWCLHGYALVHPDIRGTWMSGGDTYINSTVDGKDGYDIVEWVARQSWCNEKVAFAGNSYLSQTQWFVGAENPPHLACLAPWEGWNDLYNDTAQRGGIPNPEFQQGLLDRGMPGLGRTEDVSAMTYKYPEWNAYWEDRRARCDKITVPLYVVASWTNALHTGGTFRGWMESSSTQKWLRVHNSHEWPDLYYPQNVEDMRKFFDYYMKGVSNGWEFTPPVRLSILNPGHQDIVNRPEREFPLKRQMSRALCLDANTGKMLADSIPQQEGQARFEATSGIITFSHTFDHQTELTGYFKTKLWVQAEVNDDADLFVKISKMDAQGNVQETKCIDVGYLQDDPEAEWAKLAEMHKAGNKHVDVFYAEGATGRLRASHRRLDASRSTAHQPEYTHQNLSKLAPKEIVAVEIGMWPCGMIWEAGEQIKLSIGGHNLRPEVMFMSPPVKTCNKGGIVIYTGGEYDSHLLVPVVQET